MKKQIPDISINDFFMNEVFVFNEIVRFAM